MNNQSITIPLRDFLHLCDLLQFALSNLQSAQSQLNQIQSVVNHPSQPEPQ